MPNSLAFLPVCPGTHPMDQFKDYNLVALSLIICLCHLINITTPIYLAGGWVDWLVDPALCSRLSSSSVHKSAVCSMTPVSCLLLWVSCLLHSCAVFLYESIKWLNICLWHSSNSKTCFLFRLFSYFKTFLPFPVYCDLFQLIRRLCVWREVVRRTNVSCLSFSLS